MTPALPMPSAYNGYTPRNNGYSPRNYNGSSAPWSQPGQFMFFSDDDTPDNRRYPYQTPGSVFQR